MAKLIIRMFGHRKKNDDEDDVRIVMMEHKWIELSATEWVNYTFTRPPLVCC